MAELISQLDGPVHRLILNRPGRRNALTPSLARELAQEIGAGRLPRNWSERYSADAAEWRLRAGCRRQKWSNVGHGLALAPYRPLMTLRRMPRRVDITWVMAL